MPLLIDFIRRARAHCQSQRVWCTARVGPYLKNEGMFPAVPVFEANRPKTRCNLARTGIMGVPLQLQGQNSLGAAVPLPASWPPGSTLAPIPPWCGTKSYFRYKIRLSASPTCAPHQRCASHLDSKQCQWGIGDRKGNFEAELGRVCKVAKGKPG